MCLICGENGPNVARWCFSESISKTSNLKKKLVGGAHLTRALRSFFIKRVYAKMNCVHRIYGQYNFVQHNYVQFECASWWQHATTIKNSSKKLVNYEKTTLKNCENVRLGNLLGVLCTI